ACRQGLAVNATAARIETTAGAHDGADTRLQLSDPHLETNISRLRPSSLAIRLSHAHVASRGDPDTRIFEDAYEFFKGCRRHKNRRIDIDQNLTTGSSKGRVLRGGLPTPLGHPQQFDALTGKRTHYVVG